MSNAAPTKKRSAPPRFAVNAVIALRRRLMALMDALTPAPLVVLDRLFATQYAALIHVVVRSGVPAHLEGGPLTAAELAPKTGLDADALHRILRRLATSGIFSMDSRGRFSNNRISKALLEGAPHGVARMAEHVGIDANYQAYGKLMETARTGKSGFALATGDDVWTWFARNPREGTIFAQSMQQLTEEDAPAVAAGYPFSKHTRICDVAGGSGTLLAEILVHHPKLDAILFDADYVIAQAGDVLGPRGVDARVLRKAGSFFAPEIPTGADVYLLKNILHDWDDERCVQILKNVRAAMSPGHTLIVCELVLAHAADDYVGAIADVHMMVVCEGGRERSKEDFARLFARSGFELEEVRPLAGIASLVVGKAI